MLDYGGNFHEDFNRNRSLIASDVQGHTINQYGQRLEIPEYQAQKFIENTIRNGDNIVLDPHRHFAPWKAGQHKNSVG